MMSYFISRGNLVSEVKDNGTFTIGYPSGTNKGTFAGSAGHKMLLGQNTLLEAPYSFGLTFGAEDITVTNLSGAALPEGMAYYLELQTVGDTDRIPGINRAIFARVAYINLGAPVAADSDAIAKSQTVGAGENAVLSMTEPDVPRNIVAAWTGTAVVTVRGKDEYGQDMAESSTAGTTFTGKKAFSRIDSISASAAVTGLTAGTGKVLGLPVSLQTEAHVLGEIQDDAAVATKGTFVAASAEKPAATTGDVRGTYTPAADPDGNKSFRLVMVVTDPSWRGLDQFGG